MPAQFRIYGEWTHTLCIGDEAPSLLWSVQQYFWFCRVSLQLKGGKMREQNILPYIIVKTGETFR